MSAPRLLIPVGQHFEIRYLLRTGLLAQIARTVVPVVLLGWEDPALTDEIRALGSECHRFPAFKPGPKWEHVRSRLDVWYKIKIATPSTKIDWRRRRAMLRGSERLSKWLRELIIRVELTLPGAVERLTAEAEQASQEHTNLRDFEGPFDQLWRPDALFCLLPFQAQADPVLRLSRRRGLPCVTAILSFDNITTRGWIPILFDRYLLWNRYNAAEVRRCYGVNDDRIEIVGSPQFDFYRDPSYVWPESVWRERLGLPSGRPVIFFGAGHYKVVPNEPDWLEDLDQAVEKNEISHPAGRPVILFRRHPADPMARWNQVLNRCANVRQDTPWSAAEHNGQTDVRREDIERLASTLKHSAVHVNASSTLTVDGAIFDRPQVGPAYDERRWRRWDRACKELYEREHYLPITYSGGLVLAKSRAALIRAVVDAFAFPERHAEGRKKLVREICTFDDGRATERVARALCSCLQPLMS